MYKINNPYKNAHLLNINLMEASMYRKNRLSLSALALVGVPLVYFMVCLGVLMSPVF